MKRLHPNKNKYINLFVSIILINNDSIYKTCCLDTAYSSSDEEDSYSRSDDDYDYQLISAMDQMHIYSGLVSNNSPKFVYQ